MTEDLYTLFRRYDLNEDGEITRTELAAVLTELNGVAPDEITLAATFDALDDDKSGTISLDELRRAFGVARDLRA